MRLVAIFCVFFCFYCGQGQAEQATPFQIPRSNVVNIEDPDSGRTYPLFIKLPRSYAKAKDKSYPVIFLTDPWYSFQIVSGATRFPMNSGKMQEAIIVGISYSKGSKGPESRIRDYTHVRDASWRSVTGGAAQHAKFIEKSVFTYIEQDYRTNGSRTYVGNSLGGLFGAYMLFKHPHMFDNYIIGSPSVWFKDNDILTLKLTKNSNKHRVFIAVGAEEIPAYTGGTKDMVKGAEDLHAKIAGQGFTNTEVKLVSIAGANHETAFPTTAIQGLYWLFKTP